MTSNKTKKLPRLKMFRTMNLKISAHSIVMRQHKVLKLVINLMKEILVFLKQKFPLNSIHSDKVNNQASTQSKIQIWNSTLTLTGLSTTKKENQSNKKQLKKSLLYQPTEKRRLQAHSIVENHPVVQVLQMMDYQSRMLRQKPIKVSQSQTTLIVTEIMIFA